MLKFCRVVCVVIINCEEASECKNDFYCSGICNLLTDLGVTQAAQGSGFSGLRCAPVPIFHRY